MRINWHQNPIRTTIMLSEHERETFLLKARLREHRDAIRSALFHLDEKKKQGRFHSVEWAVRYLKHAVAEKEPEDDSAIIMLRELETGCHCGDCTCVPTMCERCMAEDILGIDTIEGLGQHQAMMIDAAFGREGARSIEEALAILDERGQNLGESEGSARELSDDSDDERALIKRAELREAREWLATYKAKHLDA